MPMPDQDALRKATDKALNRWVDTATTKYGPVRDAMAALAAERAAQDEASQVIFSQAEIDEIVAQDEVNDAVDRDIAGGGSGAVGSIQTDADSGVDETLPEDVEDCLDWLTVDDKLDGPHIATIRTYLSQLQRGCDRGVARTLAWHEKCEAMKAERDIAIDHI